VGKAEAEEKIDLFFKKWTTSRLKKRGKNKARETFLLFSFNRKGPSRAARTLSSFNPLPQNRALLRALLALGRQAMILGLELIALTGSY
jgi:hypothetical protein